MNALDPTSIDLVKIRDRQVSFLTPSEIEKLFIVYGSNKIQELRDIAILKTIYSTGLRISELTALDRTSINLKTLEFSVRGK